ncbi:MFS transporter [Conexibacter arvalis]|uniref:Putative MFS family arabinose efflux permease n=1 Tax=Conexibacter arvalis TaxID=912552 RepID=A0A840IIZ3_9ACTN|nr:MFS transporter [Conexibacter arvalis]MBB4664201.1 putative MFS family arabinose efflux permease [Conexibacter arvalis]
MLPSLPSRAVAARPAVRRLAAARLLSMTGTDASGVAIGFALYAQTRSTTWLSLSLLLTIGAGSVLAPIGGWLGDRLPRRPLMIACELGSGALFATLAIVHAPIAILAIGLLASALGSAFGPAAGASIAHVAGPERLSWANGLIASSANLGKMAGRIGGGALIAVAGPGAVFLFDALTSIASALLIASIALPFGGRERRAGAVSAAAPARGRARGALGAAEAAAPAARASTGGGMLLVLRDPGIRPVLLAACVGTFATAFSMTAEVPLVFELGGGALALGALTACWALGMVAGSWHAGRVLHAGNEATGVLAGRSLMALGIGSVALAGTLAPTLLAYLGGGFMGVAAQSLVMRRTPDDQRARVIGAMDACRNVAFGGGVVLAGFVVAPLGPSATYAFVGAGMLLGCLPLLALVRRLGGVRPLRAPRPAVAATEAA